MSIEIYSIGSKIELHWAFKKLRLRNNNSLEYAGDPWRNDILKKSRHYVALKNYSQKSNTALVVENQIRDIWLFESKFLIYND